MWTVSLHVEQTMQLIDLLCIFTKELRSLACLDLSEPKQCKLLAQARKFVRLIGSLGRYCDSPCQEQVAKELSDSCKHWDADSTMRTLLNFTDECQLIVLRLDAVMSVSFFCSIMARSIPRFGGPRRFLCQPKARCIRTSYNNYTSTNRFI